MFGGRERQCHFCQSTNHWSVNCASQVDLIELRNGVRTHNEQQLAEEVVGQEPRLVYNGGFDLETSTSAIFDRLAGNVSYPDNNSAEDDTAQDKGHVPQLARDLGRTLQLNLENKELIELADSTNTSNSIEFLSTCFSAADIATVSDGEDVESLKNTGTTKAITWDDGTKMKKTRLRNISGVPIGKAIRFVTNRGSHVCTIVRPKVDTQPDIIEKNKESIRTNTTRLQAKQSHEEMSQASGLARSDGKFHVEEGT